MASSDARGSNAQTPTTTTTMTMNCAQATKCNWQASGAPRRAGRARARRKQPDQQCNYNTYISEWFGATAAAKPPSRPRRRRLQRGPERLFARLRAQIRLLCRRNDRNKVSLALDCRLAPGVTKADLGARDECGGGQVSAINGERAGTISLSFSLAHSLNHLLASSPRQAGRKGVAFAQHKSNSLRAQANCSRPTELADCLQVANGASARHVR